MLSFESLFLLDATSLSDPIDVTRMPPCGDFLNYSNQLIGWYFRPYYALKVEVNIMISGNIWIFIFYKSAIFLYCYVAIVYLHEIKWKILQENVLFSKHTFPTQFNFETENEIFPFEQII